MQKFGFESKEVAARLYEALETGRAPNGETLQSVMEDIQELLYACYMLGINPLHGLRKVFPQYQWRYYKLENFGYIERIISKSDFIWRNCLDGDENQIVTATKLDRLPSDRLNYFWAGNKSDASNPEIDFIESVGGVPVYWIMD